MSIHRWGASGRTGLPEVMPDGEWVRYADHVAEVEAMRAACIAAVEEVDGGRAVLIFRRNVLSALNEVQT